MSERARHGPVLAAALAVSIPLGLAASGLVPFSVAELTAASDVAVLGRVVRIASHRHGGLISTRIDVEPAEALKGRPTGTVSLALPGAACAADVPCLSAGEEVVLFLEADGPGTYRIVQQAEGKFRVVRPAGGEARVERDLPGIRGLRDAMGSGGATTLEGLTRAVRGAPPAPGRR